MANIVSLAEVRQHLRYSPTDTTDDAELQVYMNAADDVVKAECGDVLPTQYDEYHDGGNYYIYCRHRPVIEIVNVEEGWGWWNWELDYQQVNTVPAGAMFAYSLDSQMLGSISRRSAGNVSIPFVPGSKNIHIQYIAGRADIPGSAYLFELELIAFWWRNSQMRAMTTAATTTQAQAVNADFTRAEGVSSINLGVPAGLLELLKGCRKTPIIS
jgi:hypothetical protein